MTSHPLVVGVDAGANHTEAAIATPDLTVLGRARGPAGALAPGRVLVAAGAIEQTIEEAMRVAHVTRHPSAATVGAAGAGREEERGGLEAELARRGLAERLDVTTDAAIALADAFGHGAGIVIIAGTGSIAYGRLEDGTMARTGGHGWQAGDEGSGYSIGRAGLSAVGKAADGRGPATVLTEAFLRRIGGAGHDDLVRWATHAPRQEVSHLAGEVLDAAAAGDPVSQELVSAAATELTAHVVALARRFDGPVAVAFAGGVLKAGATLRATMREMLAAQAPMVRVIDEPVDSARGAIKMALELLGTQG